MQEAAAPQSPQLNQAQRQLLEQALAAPPDQIAALARKSLPSLPDVDRQAIQPLLDRPPTTVRIEDVSDLTPALMPLSPDLEDLTLASPFVSSRGLNGLMRRIPQGLQRLHLVNARELTLEGMNQFFRSLPPNIRSLSFERCDLDIGSLLFLAGSLPPTIATLSFQATPPFDRDITLEGERDQILDQLSMRVRERFAGFDLQPEAEGADPCKEELDSELTQARQLQPIKSDGYIKEGQ